MLRFCIPNIFYGNNDYRMLKCSKAFRQTDFIGFLQNQMDLHLILLDIHCNVYSQIFFENLFPNRRFGVEIVHLNTISSNYDHYSLNSNTNNGGIKMQYNKVEICGVNTSKLPVMKESEKEKLLKLTKSGDYSAREQLICGNLRLVLSVIQRFTGRGENLDDLFQVGCIGLIKAIDNFDISQNVRFSTYAVPMIIGEIRRYLRDNNSIRVSRSIKDLAYKAMQVKERLTAKNQKEPTVEQIAKELGVKKQDVVIAFESVVEPISLYEPVYSDNGDTIYVLDQVGDKNDDENWIDEIVFKESIKKLNDREKKILRLRFFDGKTQMEVSEEIGISQAQVSRLEKSALQRIKNNV